MDILRDVELAGQNATGETPQASATDEGTFERMQEMVPSPPPVSSRQEKKGSAVWQRPMDLRGI